jgi:hypothetical protein
MQDFDGDDMPGSALPTLRLVGIAMASAAVTASLVIFLGSALFGGKSPDDAVAPVAIVAVHDR